MNRLRTSLLFYSPLSIVFERIAVSEIAYCILHIAVSHIWFCQKSSVNENRYDFKRCHTVIRHWRYSRSAPFRNFEIFAQTAHKNIYRFCDNRVLKVLHFVYIV